MHRGMSYRKPAPVYIPSPPPSPTEILSAGRREEERPPVISYLSFTVASGSIKNLKLPEDWHDVIAQARKNYNINLGLSACESSGRTPANLGSSKDGEDGHSGRVQPVSLAIPPEDVHQLPRLAPPVYFASKFGNARIYRPPTPPRPSNHKRRVGLADRDTESQNPSGNPLNRQPRFVEIPVDSYSRRESSISLPSSGWQSAELPKDWETREHDQPMWWDTFKSLGVLIKSRIKSFKEYGALC
ncbi:hypothetical protein DFH08DRAFT_796335 [Mycena albidolilacea]|uniref:Uncharacterized protein n=1 Tax=Mycena albidolilacea TaxID=1033008 RepID=A0AAD7AUV9_9AGAR|nr:hypothetical protein DFH08DRAFT_796335 [Mycena albidolilacea]